MKNVSGHTVEWSMQSVSQYDTGNAADPSHGNREIWGFTPTNPSSAYLNRYHVRTGPAENPAATVREDGLFPLHYAISPPSFGWIRPMVGWRSSMEAAATPWSSDFNTKNETLSREGFRHFLDQRPCN